MADLIRLSGVSKTIPQSLALALRDATCVIGQGEFVSIVGASGSGKTTLLSILGLLDQPSTGTYTFGGVDVASLGERERNQFRGLRIGFVFQNSYTIAEESVERNVGLGLRVRGVSQSQQRGLIETALAQVDLVDLLKKRAGDLSGGEKQRVAVARALVTCPEVILADEPTGALDSESTKNLINLLHRINDKGTTVVVVTHDPLVAGAAHRIIQIEDGIVSRGTVTEGDQRGIQELDLGSDTSWQRHEEAAEQPVTHATVQLAGSLGGTRHSRLFQEAADALIAPYFRLLRSLLVLLAYILGVAGTVAAIGVMSGTTGHIVHRLTEAGSNQIQVSDTSGSDGSWASLDERARTVGQLEGVRHAVPLKTFTVVSNDILRLRGLGGKFTGRILMTDERFMMAQGMVAISGSVELLSNPWNGAVVALGSGAAETLGVPAAEAGVCLWVNDRPVDVVAVLAPTGDVLLDNALYFSPGSEVALVDPLDRLVEVQTEPGYAEPLAKAIPMALSPTNPGQIQVSTVAQLALLQQGINTDLGMLLSLIGWVILILSTLTAGTTMFLSVQHRSAEIALRRSMGASRGSVFRLFCMEGIGIGTTGGILGTALGIGLTIVVTWVNQWPLSLGLHVVPMGAGVGLVAGGVASIVPAMYASQRDPARILRTV